MKELELMMVRNGKTPPSFIPNNLNARFAMKHGKLPSNMLPKDLNARFAMKHGKVPSNMLPKDLNARFAMKHGKLPDHMLIERGLKIKDLPLRQRMQMMESLNHPPR
jgi:hypothetical protein